jgi:hypothetical protein
MDDPMKIGLLSVLFAALVAGAAVYTPAVDGQPEADQIDFASLHSQAASALQVLQTSQAQRITLAETTAAF